MIWPANSEWTSAFIVPCFTWLGRPDLNRPPEPHSGSYRTGACSVWAGDDPCRKAMANTGLLSALAPSAPRAEAGYELRVPLTERRDEGREGSRRFETVRGSSLE